MGFVYVYVWISQEATRLGYYVKNKDGGEYENWCWPGDAMYIIERIKTHRKVVVKWLLIFKYKAQ